MIYFLRPPKTFVRSKKYTFVPIFAFYFLKDVKPFSIIKEHTSSFVAHVISHHVAASVTVSLISEILKVEVFVLECFWNHFSY